MRSAHLYLFCCLCAVSAQNVGSRQAHFPTFRVSREPVLFGALFELSPIVAIGDLSDVSEFAVQAVDRLPPPIPETLHILHWCQATFRAVAVVKGSLPKANRYVWGAIEPGCRLFYGNRESYEKRLTRIWFLRSEEGLLRPLDDAGSAHFHGIFARWSEGPDLPPRQRLGLLLLTPEAVASSRQEFAESMWDDADVACSLLGKPECVRRIKALTTLGEPALRRAACEYLRAQQGEDCETQERQ